MTNYIYFKKIIWLIIYIFLSKLCLILNVSICMHECMCYKLKKKILIWLIIYIFIIKILFNFKCIHAFAWSYMLNASLYITWSSPSLVSFTNGNQGKDTKSSQSHFYHIWLWATISLILRCSKEIISHYPP